MAKDVIPDYNRSMEFEEASLFESHGIQCGFTAHRGEMPDLPKYVPTLKITFATTDHDGKFVSNKKISYKEPGMSNLNQITLPDKPEAVLKLGEFCIAYHDFMQKEAKAKLKEAQKLAKEAGVST